VCGFAADQQQADFTAPERAVTAEDVFFSEETGYFVPVSLPLCLPGDYPAESPGCRFSGKK
jgi:hypothetical protein